MVKGQISNSSAAHPAFGNLFKLNVARLDAGSFPAASNSSSFGESRSVGHPALRLTPSRAYVTHEGG